MQRSLSTSQSASSFFTKPLVSMRSCLAMEALRYNAMAASALTRPSPPLSCRNVEPVCNTLTTRALTPTRRWPFVMVLVCYGFQPTAVRSAVLLALNHPLPSNVKIPPIVMRTWTQRRAFLSMAA